ncbi:MAG: hypothetical protein QQN51_07925 [Nitrosopumilus sp.]
MTSSVNTPSSSTTSDTSVTPDSGSGSGSGSGSVESVREVDPISESSLSPQTWSVIWYVPAGQFDGAVQVILYVTDVGPTKES